MHEQIINELIWQARRLESALFAAHRNETNQKEYCALGEAYINQKQARESLEKYQAMANPPNVES